MIRISEEKIEGNLLEIISFIKEPIKSEIISEYENPKSRAENYRKEYNTNAYISCYKKSFIDRLFVWSATIKGHEYWFNISRKPFDEIFDHEKLIKSRYENIDKSIKEKLKNYM